jgi:anhydro-N-acetylmuramic acid kinase
MTENKVYTAIGLMSGTSLDGVDAAVIETDGLGFVKPKGFVSIPYESAEREVIRACFGTRERYDPKIKEAEELVTLKHAEAVKRLGVKSDVIGFHGQTVFHAPKEGITVQIGDGDLLARETGMDVVDNFRIADVKAGGEGAPLAPLYHAARIRSAGLELPVVVLNIGGVANVTWIGEGVENIIAFDTGPGNALMDDWARMRTGKLFDENGAMAGQGKPVEALLKEWAEHFYFSRKPPKSLDRDQWDIAALGKVTQGMAAVSDEDGAATLMRFSADMIARSVEHMPQAPKSWYACGGGRHNKVLMAYLYRTLAARGYGMLRTVDDLGWDGDATEAECFAYLAVRSLMGLPISLPGTTGVPMAMTGGTLHKV